MDLTDFSHLSRISSPLLDWYSQTARVLPWRSDPTPYHVWLSEIMLQQTRVEAVKGYYHRFLEVLPTIEALAFADEELLLKLWEGLGYYNRVRNLQNAAQVVVAAYGGDLPADYEALLKLPGIGRYTAGAISSIAFGLPCPAVDGNVLRVIARVTASEENTSKEPVKRSFESALAAAMPPQQASAFNQALMELGATVCLPNGAPRCESCPLAQLCKAHQLGNELVFPLKDEKRPRCIQQRTVFVLLSQNRVAVQKRPQKGLLRGLWEFPSTKGQLDPDAAICYLKTIGITAHSLTPLAEAKHIFTHLEWHMTGFAVACVPAETCLLTWVSLRELRETYSLPGALKVYTAALDALLKEEPLP